MFYRTHKDIIKLIRFPIGEYGIPALFQINYLFSDASTLYEGKKKKKKTLYLQKQD